MYVASQTHLYAIGGSAAASDEAPKVDINLQKPETK
jgi:hypothetical protein